MDEDEIEIDLDDVERRMNGAMAALRQEFASLRTGRASAVMLDPLMVSAYGTSLPLNQCGTVSVPDPRMLAVSVWDKGVVDAVVKSINESGLGINPIVEGTLIRLPIPELNEERRRELSRVAAQYSENARIAIRNVRRSAIEKVKKAKNDGMSEDDAHFWSEEIQELTDKAVANVDNALEGKKTEIMQV